MRAVPIGGGGVSEEREELLTYRDIREAVQQVLDRDAIHDWDETARLTEVVAPHVWNLLLAVSSNDDVVRLDNRDVIA